MSAIPGNPRTKRDTTSGVRRGPGRPPRRDWQQTFLDCLSATGSEPRSAKKAKVPLSVVGAMKHRDPAFTAAVNEAKAEGVRERAIRKFLAGPATLARRLELLSALRPARSRVTARARRRTERFDSGPISPERVRALARRVGLGGNA